LDIVKIQNWFLKFQMHLDFRSSKNQLVKVAKNWNKQQLKLSRTAHTPSLGYGFYAANWYCSRIKQLSHADAQNLHTLIVKCIPLYCLSYVLSRGSIVSCSYHRIHRLSFHSSTHCSSVHSSTHRSSICFLWSVTMYPIRKLLFLQERCIVNGFVVSRFKVIFVSHSRVGSRWTPMLFLFPSRSQNVVVQLVQVISDLVLFFELDLKPYLFFQVYRVDIRLVFTLKNVVLSRTVNNIEYKMCKLRILCRGGWGAL
jgi:hypothetical protein